MRYIEEREDMCVVVKKMFDRFMTNAAGGNVSIKVDENLYLMTPTLMSQNKFCDLKPWEILLVDNEGKIIEGEGGLTREFSMHLATYEKLPNASAVIHAHPKEAMVFASLGIPLPSLSEGTKKLGTIITLPFKPAATNELADLVRGYFSNYINKNNQDIPAAVLLREHGILVADKSLRKAYDLLERIEYNAYVNIQENLFKIGAALGVKEWQQV